MIKKLISTTLVFLFLATSAFPKIVPFPQQVSIVIIVDETPERITVTPLEYQGASNVIVDVLNASDQVLNSAQTTPGHSVVFSRTGQEYKVRARFYNDSWGFVIMDEENM